MTARSLVETVVDDPRWETLGLEAVGEAAARAAVAVSGLDPERLEISLLGTSDARSAVLNGSFRGKPDATNVLSWPASDRAPDDPLPAEQEGEPILLGDLALAWETCLGEAQAAGIPLRDHVSHLVVHGVLHLLGHRHDADAEAERMEALEAKALAMLGVANPYGA